MKWHIDPKRPIYLQLIEQVERHIISGDYRPGDKLPSVRELAKEAAVNPNTMQRALATLEQSGLLFTQRTAGRYITEDTQLIENIRGRLASETIATFLKQMQQMGFDRKKTIALLIQKEDIHE
ncbi:GntR family transcriptional regulator [Pseudoramibacter faecis]|uniref:GntR family transcriptional regulator n=1 Tax=Pseudoramibacter faecis TaxID=3108534 RepID=UPI002E788C59|nr:GntR family transcriptional regulator [Pseudoramibacter sp. HA2172]